MRLLTTAFLLIVATLTTTAKDYTVSSPDGNIKVYIKTGKSLTYSIERGNTLLLAPSDISLTLADGRVWGPNNSFSATLKEMNTTCQTAVFKRSTVKDHCQELVLRSREFSLCFRVYDDGVAWRFIPKKAITVKNEQATFAFADDWQAYIPYVCQNTETLESQFHNSFESQYDHHPLSQWNKERLAFLPVTIEAANGIKLCLVESDLLDYPGMFLYNSEGDQTLKGVFAPVPDETKQGGYNNLQRAVKTRKNIIAENTQILPWRGIVIATEDKQLAESDFTWRLATPADNRDWSWVKPGKVAWDWWNNWNIYGVDFEAGINNETYKYYIDFAASKSIEYVILDDGWSVPGKADLMQIIPQIDIPMLARYAEEKGVGLILWAGHMAFDRDMDAVCKHYSELGIKGWKIDFMNYDDQQLVQFYHRDAKTAAKYHMLVDFHGAFKPAGLPRTYPNVVNFEGVFGLENMKWAPSNVDQITYDVTIPFTRLVAGPADYTQGAMRNAAKDCYYPCNSEPMSQGTRCHQLAEYIIFDAPLTMLCDAPSNYLQEPECTDFIAGVPTVWDETIALDGKIGEYVVLARRKGNQWFVGALNGLEARDLTLDLSFIPKGEAIVFSDGANAHRAGKDYKKRKVSISQKMAIHLAPGGGWVMQTKPNKAQEVIAALHDPASRYVLVAAHRGDWRNYPENSLLAIESVIRMGADIMELDLKRTKDGVLVLCHDETLDRTTTGSGPVSNYTYDELLKFDLKRGHGIAIPGLKIPTLRQALEVCKDRIVVNVDKGYEFYDQVLTIAEELGMTDQILIKSGNPHHEVQAKLSQYPRNLMYMPVVNVSATDNQKVFHSYLESPRPPIVFELCFGKLDQQVKDAASKVKKVGSKIWVNTIWGSLCGNHDDDRAFESMNPDEIYQPILDLGTSIIQTDRPEFIINYLKNKGRH